MSAATKIRVAQLGLGPIGLETLKLAATKPWAEVVGALEIDPAKCGRDLGELTGLESLRGAKVYARGDELLKVGKPDVILHTSVSKFAEAFEQIVPLVEHGVNVVSSCEELVFPQLREPKLAAQLDDLCRAHRARVVGAGVNPGFVMDLLPLCLTSVVCGIRAIHIERVVNASTRRGPLQKKIGAGLAPEQFRPLLERGNAGHAGLRESLGLMAHGLSWQIDRLAEKADVIIADHPIRTRHFAVEPGQVCGIRQRVEATTRDSIVLTLGIQMCLDAIDPHDSIRVDGNPPLNVRIEGGIAGDEATVASLVNTIPRLLQASPGLRLLTDLALPRMG
jgi:2,4-diaminopentanoate dehydrogenase